jgi:UDP-glucose 4-epimerase
MNKIAIFGGSGFLGTDLTRLLIKKHPSLPIQIFGISPPPNDVLQNRNVDFIKYDVQEGNIPEINDVNIILFKIGILGGPSSTLIENSEKYLNLNSYSLYKIVEQWKDKSNNKKIIFDSSDQVYGYSNIVCNESSEPKPINFYGVSKILSEKILRYFNLTKHIKCIIFRYPRVHAKFSEDVITSFCRKVLLGKPIEIYNNKRLDFIHISDVSEANLKALSTDVNFGIINLGNGESYSLIELANMIQTIAGKRVEILIKHQKSSFEPNQKYLITNNMRELLNFQAKVSMEEMIMETLSYLEGQIGGC